MLEDIDQKMTRLEFAERRMGEVEEKLSLVRKENNTLKSQIDELRQKLVNAEEALYFVDEKRFRTHMTNDDMF